MLPQMMTEPSATGLPDAVHIVDRSCTAPMISVVMRHPTPRAILLLGRACAADHEIVNHVEQRLVTLTEIRDLDGPIVHLGVDVDRVFTFPRRIELLVPDALKISGLVTRTAAGDEKITSVLEMQRRQRRIIFQR